MRLIKKHYLLLLVLVAFGFGCRSCDTVESNKIAQSTIYQDYEIFATKDSTSVTATFRVGGSGGTTIDLDAPSRIEYNGKELTENLRTMFGGTNYSFSGGFQSSNQFSYTNGDGRTMANGISFDPIEPVPGAREIKPREKTLILLSRPVGENESLETTISSLEPTPTPLPQNGNTEVRGNTGVDTPQYTRSLHNNLNGNRNGIEIDAGELKNFAPGQATLRISVKGNSELQQKTETGGSINYTYSSQLIAVTVLK